MPSALFEEVSGDDWIWNLQMLQDDSDDPISGLLYATSKGATMKRWAGDQSKTVLASSVTCTDDTNGLVTVVWAKADTITMEGGFWWCEIWFDGVGGYHKTGGPFAVSVRKSITQT